MKDIQQLLERMLKGIALFMFIVVAGSALAETAGATPGAAPQAAPGKMSAVGRWQTIDDKTGQPRAIVRIYEVGGAYQGEIEKVFYAPGEKKSGLCEQCPEPQRGKPVVGMTILWGLHTDKVGRGYLGGQILDPANATIYKCKLWLGDSGNTLDVRGYIGFTGVLGRTQRWQRIS